MRRGVRWGHRNGGQSWLNFTATLLMALTGLSAAFPAQASTLVVGTIPGSFGVTPTGAATYAVPIAVPRGSGGLTPSIGLIYNSQSGEGAAGYGWTLSGLSAITRCPKTIDDDGVTQAVQLNVNDDYCLDGQRLRSTGTNTYDTELRQYDQITATNGTNGADHFEVQTKDGSTYEYGNTADSKILATGTSTVRVWALDKVTDANHNYYTITYQNNDTSTGDYWPLSIQYTGNTLKPSSPDHTIAFSWTPRSDSTVQTSFLQGSLISQTQLLSGITVSYNGATAFTYTLQYQTDSGTGRNQLSQVQECAADGSCFAPTTIAWQDGTAGWQGDTSASATIANANEAESGHLVDVNGDGIMDLVYPNTVGTTTDWWVMFGLPGGGFGAPVDTGIAADPTYYPYALAMDYNGDGRSDLLVPEASGAWEVLVSTGSVLADNIFTATSTTLSTPGNNTTNNLPIYEGSAWVVDFSGHGLGDFAYTNGTEVYLVTNNGPVGSPRFGSPQPVYSVGTSGSSNALFTRSTTSSFVDTPLDFDGSGRGGALAAYETTKTCKIDGCTPPPPVFGYTALLATPGPTYTPMANVSGVQLTPDPMDATGSGLTDLLYACCTVPNQVNTYYFQVELSTGTTFIPVSTTVVDNFITDSVVADYFGDGRQEAIVEPTTGTWDMIRVNYDPPSESFVAAVTSASAPYPSSYLGGTLRIGNIEANGLNDLVYVVQSGSTYTWHYNLHAGGAGDLVTTITDGMGNVFEPAYASLPDNSSVYTEGTGAIWPYQDVQFPLQVVASYQASDGAGGLYTKTYTYSGAQFETQGHGFLGFASRTATDSRNGVEVTDTYDQTWPWIGDLAAETVTQSNGNSLSNIANTYASSPSSCTTGALCFAYRSQSIGKAYDVTSGNLIKKVVTQNTFDSNGDLTNQTVTVTDKTSGAQFITTTATGYANDTSNYCIDLPTSVTITKTNPNFPSGMSRSTASPQDTSACRPASVTLNPGSSPTLTTAFGYDAWGNPQTVTVSGTGLPTNRETTIDYTTYNGEYPDEIKNALNQIAYETWNPALGTQTSVTDVNGHTTSFWYDDFGRKTSETHADGTVTHWTAPQSTSGGGCLAGVECYSISASESAGSATIPLGAAIYDAEGRVIAQQKTLLGGVISTVETTYNGLGEVTAVTSPFLPSQTVYSTTYSSYDVLGRPLTLTAPASASSPTGDSTTIGYDGFTTTATKTQTPTPSTGIDSEQTITTTDALGEVISKTDTGNTASGTASSSTTYTYYPFGDLFTTTDADGNITTLYYDGLGHKTKMADPNMGTWTYTPDALGEVLTQTDADSQEITQIYDPLGRLTSRTEYDAGGSVTVSDAWSWDTATNGIGLLASESDSNGFSKSYSYDSLSRPIEVDTTVPGTTTPYAVNTSYDSFGRVSTVTYPASVAPLLPTAEPVAKPTTAQADTDNITLYGQGSTDPNGLSLNYQWSYTGSGSSKVFITNPTNVQTIVCATVAGSYTFYLVVSDQNGSSSPATVTVTFTAPPPGSTGCPGQSGGSGSITPVDMTTQIAATGGAILTAKHEHGGIHAVLAQERRMFAARLPIQASEAVMQELAARAADAGLPSLLPPAPAEDVAAWNAWDAAYKRAHPNGPDYAPPEYIADADAKLELASGTPYRFEVAYQYDPASGALTTVENAQTGFIYWQADTGSAAPVDAFGHLLAYTDGNDVSTVMAYDQATGAPVGISSGIGQSSAVQSLIYAWDGYGNLEERQDANQTLSETFQYDDLNRLHQSTVTNPANNGPTLTWNYDPMGN
ncbi:MAG: PKD domain-containing protein, partial [Gammaproteobacteria bacterium]